jgi:hypothetical protein
MQQPNNIALVDSLGHATNHHYPMILLCQLQTQPGLKKIRLHHPAHDVQQLGTFWFALKLLLKAPASSIFCTQHTAACPQHSRASCRMNAIATGRKF